MRRAGTPVVLDWRAVAEAHAGFFSFTEITDPAEHRSYNAWHQLDHMPEQFPLAGMAYGQRWVSTPACTAARVVADPVLAPVHYLTLYLMSDPVHVTLREFMALAERLRDEDRFHGGRRARLAGPVAVTGMSAAPRVRVSPEAVPYRPNRGVYAVVRSGRPGSLAAPGPTLTGHAGAARDEADARLAQVLAADPAVAGVWSFRTDRRFDRHSWRPGDLSLTLCYLDEDPVRAAARLGARLTAAAPGSDSGGPTPAVVFAGPFETIIPWQWDWFDDTR